MPQKKMIDRDNIPYKKVDETIVEQRNCLWVKLIFNEPFTKEQAEIMRTFYKGELDETNCILTRNVKNSWKGLTMFFLSLSVLKYQMYALSKIVDTKKMISKPSFFRLFGSEFSSFMPAREFEDIQSKALQLATAKMDPQGYMTFMPAREFDDIRLKALDLPEGKYDFPRYWGEKACREQCHAIEKVRQKLIEQELLTQRAPDPTFENVPVPPGYRPHYVRADFDNAHIVAALAIFGKLFNIDTAKSEIRIVELETIPRIYDSKPAVYVKPPEKKLTPDT